MSDTLLLIGIACIIAAVVGGGLKILHVELPAVASVQRQVLLALVGSLLVVGSFALPEPVEAPTPSAPGEVAPAGPPPPVQQPPFDVPPPGPGRAPDISLSPGSGPAGTSISVSGTGFAPGETVVIRFHTRELDRIQADQQGGFPALTAQVPPDWPFDGQFHVIATGNSSLRSARLPFEVTR